LYIPIPENPSQAWKKIPPGMKRVVSIDAPPGTLGKILHDIPRPGVLLLPTTTPEGHAETLADALVQTVKACAHRMSTISRCIDNDSNGNTNDANHNNNDILVCAHWYDIPYQIPMDMITFVTDYVSRHIQSMYMAHNLHKRILHTPVILDFDTPYAFEILLEDMSAGSLSSSDIEDYSQYMLRTIPETKRYVIPISNRAIDTTYLRSQIIERIMKTVL
jgi:hypothetical protein